MRMGFSMGIETILVISLSNLCAKLKMQLDQIGYLCCLSYCWV